MACEVSIILTIRNVEKFIEDCLDSILNQSFRDFEIVIVDDDSIDDTQEIIQRYNDKRIKYHKNPIRLGLTKNRNRGLKYAEGKYVFFTDGDCIVSKNWVEEGLKYFKKYRCVGVEGKLFYVSKNYLPTFSDHASKNELGGLYMTGNMAYEKAVIFKVRGFDERYNYHEDRDIGLRIKKIGLICFNPNMIVFVQREVLTPQRLIDRAGVIKNRVYLFKRFGDKSNILWRIVEPLSLLKLLFPPLIFAALLSKRFKSSSDFRLFPYQYIYLILERLGLWKTCVKENIFLI